LRASTPCASFFARVRARTQPLAPVGQATQRSCPLVRRPHQVEQPCRQEAGQRPRVEPIRFRFRVTDRAQLSSVGDDDPNALSLQQRDDLVRTCRRLERNNISRRQAAREQLQRLNPRRDPPGRSHLSILRDRDFAEVAVYIQPKRAHAAPFVDEDGSAVGQRQRRIRALGTPG